MQTNQESSAGIGMSEGASISAAVSRTEFLCRLWAEALEQPSVGLDDDFFALGGDSLAVARIVVTAAAEGLTIDPTLFIQHRTIRELERQLNAMP